MAKSTSFIIYFIIFLSTLSYNPALSCPQHHKLALLQFKSIVLAGNYNVKSSLIVPEFNLDSWNSSSDRCRWDRVLCDSLSSSKPVIVLNLSMIFQYPTPKYPTAGILAPLFRINSLIRLDVSYNYLQGEIPVNIFSNLTQLVYLDLSYNAFNGSIPPQLFSLQNLQYLYMRDNSFSGPIPMEIGNLYKISVLVLSNNRLSGEILKSIKKMGWLEQLYLKNNSLYGEIPAWLFDVKGLKQLHLGGNKLKWNNSGRITPKCSLSLLILQSCGITGSFPQWLIEMDIEYINLSDNNLLGSLPSRLFESQNLRVLILSGNNFSGELPVNIGNTHTIQVLVLARNNFSGSLPESMSNIRDLYTLDLSENNFSGDKFPKFYESYLIYADLSSNKFYGAPPLSFGRLIKVLKLGQNNFSGRLHVNLTDLSFLEHLDLHNNNIVGELPYFLTQAFPLLQVLILRNNSLEGSIPNGLSNLKDLRILDLSSNNLVGNIPPELGNLMGMIEMPYTNNVLINLTIVQNISVLVNWKDSMRFLPSITISLYSLLDLSKNQFSGEIPPSLGELKSLKSLNISYNHLSGQIPASFGKLKSMENLDLSHNKISGKIPETFVNLYQLSRLNVRNNRLTGHFPIGSQMNTLNNPDDYANNSGLCGMQIGLPCPMIPPLELSPTSSQSEDKEPWFSWEAAAIGYAIGLILVVASAYFAGFLSTTNKPHPLRDRRLHQGRM
ncbi:receptor-like protein 46 [Tasmannia lanceolata]|uniref:receptor-like protein 46 n=1 Tax=Tasmannia lanceolata TaxID=3420 RepID=UPI004062ABED